MFEDRPKWLRYRDPGRLMKLPQCPVSGTGLNHWGGNVKGGFGLARTFRGQTFCVG